MPNTNTYNSKDISLSVSTRTLEAFSSDSTIDLEKTDDDVTQSVGLNGDLTHNESNSTIYSLNFSLKPESEDNQFLRGLRESKTLFACLYKNNSSGETTTLTGCRFVKPAIKTDGAEVGERAWSIVGLGLEVL